jgi:hypothetical protein
VKGELVEHENGVYTAPRDPQTTVIYGPAKAMLVRYTHQLTAETLDLAWRFWFAEFTSVDAYVCDNEPTPPLPAPRLRWWRVLPVGRHSEAAGNGYTYVYRAATPGTYGAFPCIHFDEDTVDLELLAQVVIDVLDDDLVSA